MKKMFPETMNMLSALSGFQGALIVNVDTGQVLDYSENSSIKMTKQVASSCVKSLKKYASVRQDLKIADILEQFFITTSKHYHIFYNVPQFDNVVIYIIFQRYTMKHYIAEQMEHAILSMH